MITTSRTIINIIVIITTTVIMFITITAIIMIFVRLFCQSMFVGKQTDAQRAPADALAPRRACTPWAEIIDR